MTTYALTLLILLAIKHFIADGPLQVKYQYANKGDVRHPGGYIHAGIHGSCTLVAFWISYLITGEGPSPSLALFLSAMDGIVHYGVDWTKVNKNKKSWASGGKDEDGKACLRIYSDWYFYALILDQVMHFITYIVIVYLAVL